MINQSTNHITQIPNRITDDPKLINAKRYLEQTRKMRELIDSDLAELSELKELRKSVPSSSISDMPHGGSRNTEAHFVRTVEKITDLEQKIEEKIGKYIDLKSEMFTVIGELENPTEKLILRLRYMESLTWEQIAERLDYSAQGVHRIHKKGLKNLRIPENN